MRGSLKFISLMAVISLFLGVIWLPMSFAATVPTLAPLGSLNNLSQAMRIAMDSSGNFYVTKGSAAPGTALIPSDNIVKLDALGNVAMTYPSMQLSGPIALSPDNSLIYVSLGRGKNSGDRDGVAVLNAVDGSVLRYIGPSNAADGRGEFNKVMDLAVDSNGWLYVADDADSVVRVYDATEAFQFQIAGPCGASACTAGQVKGLYSIALDEAGNSLYISDRSPLAYSTDASDQGNVQVYNLATGAFRHAYMSASLGGNIDASTAFKEYLGLALDGQGRFYVVDTANSYLRVNDTAVLPPADASLAGYDVTQAGSTTRVYDTVFDSANSRLIVMGVGGVSAIGVDGGTNPSAQNAPPTVPVQISPVANTIVSTSSPVLDFAASTDANGNAISYQVSLVIDGGTAVVSDVAAGTTSFSTSGLQENGHYSWQVKSTDDLGDSLGWSAATSFYVDAVNNVPVAPALVSPLAGELLDEAGLLSWQAATDPDPADTLTYQVEIASDSGFSVNIFTGNVDVTTMALSQLPDTMVLTPGSSYFWRVKSVDSHGAVSAVSAAGSFSFSATDFQVNANMPGAKVSIGGTLAFSGRALGVTPLVVRGLAPGLYTVVVERAGFEPMVEQTEIFAGQANAFYANLRPAVAPTDIYDYRNGVKSLVVGTNGSRLANVKFKSGSSSPSIVDLNGDGILDLVAGQGDGAVSLLASALVNPVGRLETQAAVSVLPPLAAGAVPFVADWDNDNHLDLLMGLPDGSVGVYLNQAQDNSFVYGATPQVLMADGQPLNAGSAASPCVVDVDQDGAKDLVVGTGQGDVLYFHNSGTDDVPVLNAAGSLATVAGPAYPCFNDWDADGTPELLIGANNRIFVYALGTDGKFALSQSLVVVDRTGLPVSLGTGLRIAVWDADGKDGKDIIVGDTSGKVRFFVSRGTNRVAAFKAALLDKADQLQTLVDAQAPTLSNQAVSVRTAIQAGSDANGYSAAMLNINFLLKDLDPAGSAFTAANELKQLL